MDNTQQITHNCTMEGGHGAYWVLLTDFTTSLFVLASALHGLDDTPEEMSQYGEIPPLDACFNSFLPHGWGNNILMLIEKKANQPSKRQLLQNLQNSSCPPRDKIK